MTNETSSVDTISRRTVLKAGAVGVGAFAASTSATASGDEKNEDDGTADESDDIELEELRLVGEVPIQDTSILDVQGNYVYVSTWNGFVVVDAHDPSQPQNVAEVAVPGVGVHENYLKVDQDRLAVTSQGNGLAPLRGVDEAELEEVDPDEFGVQLYDVSDPVEPVHLGMWHEPPAGIHSHAFDGDYLYLSRAFPIGDSALRIIDVSDPANPTEVAEWRVEDEHPELDQPVNFLHNVHVQDDLAYLAYWDAGCRILDVSDPSDPVEVSAFGEAPEATEPVEGDFDALIEEPESEFTQRFLGLPGNTHSPVPSADGNYVYLGEETYVGSPGGIRIFDISDHEDPIELTRIDPPSDRTFEFAHYYEVTPDRLHSSWIEGGVRVFDISDPADPVETGRYDPEGFHSENSVARLSFTVSTFEGAGVVFLHPDLGEQRPPTIGDHEDEHDEEP